MARIRTYKPEIFSDSATGQLSGDAFKLFLGLVAQSDDYGFVAADVPEIIAEILPFWGLSRLADVANLLGEISRAKRNKPQPLLAAVEHEGTTFFVIPRFLRHQKVDRPSRPTVPLSLHKSLTLHAFDVDERGNVTLGEPYCYAFIDDDSPNARRTIDEGSTSPRRALDEDSTSPRRALDEDSTSARSRARADLRDRKDLKDLKDRKDQGDARARETGAPAPEPPPLSSPSAHGEEDPEPEPNTPDAVEREWTAAAAIMGRVPGKCSRKDLAACLRLCPNPLDRQLAFELVFTEAEPPAFNFVVADLAKWVARGRADAADVLPSRPPDPDPPAPPAAGPSIAARRAETTRRDKKSLDEQIAALTKASTA